MCQTETVSLHFNPRKRTVQTLKPCGLLICSTVRFLQLGPRSTNFWGYRSRSKTWRASGDGTAFGGSLAVIRQSQPLSEDDKGIKARGRHLRPWGLGNEAVCNK